MKVCTSWRGGPAIHFSVALSPSTVIKTGIRTGNSVLYRKWDLPRSVTNNVIFVWISEKLGLSWWGLEAHSEKCLGARLSGHMASDNVVCTLSSRQGTWQILNPKLNKVFNFRCRCSNFQLQQIHCILVAEQSEVWC